MCRREAGETEGCSWGRRQLWELSYNIRPKRASPQTTETTGTSSLVGRAKPALLGTRTELESLEAEAEGEWTVRE